MCHTHTVGHLPCAIAYDAVVVVTEKVQVQDVIYTKLQDRDGWIIISAKGERFVQGVFFTFCLFALVRNSENPDWGLRGVRVSIFNDDLEKAVISVHILLSVYH